MKLRIDNRDLAFTIDTYGMFTGDSVEDMEREHYADTYALNLDEVELNFEYNHPGVVKRLAEESISLLWDQFCGIVGNRDGIVRNITLDKTTSPQFYNYTTDSYVAIWDVNIIKLKNWIRKNRDNYDTYLTENYDAYDREKLTPGSESYDQEYHWISMIDFYTRTEYDPEEYESHMFEKETEAWMENMDLDAESKKLIEGKEPVNV